MRKIIYTIEVNTFAYEVDENNHKIESSMIVDNVDTWDELHIFADDGKVFRRKSTGEILTAHIGIGSDDNVNDFEEIDI